MDEKKESEEWVKNQVKKLLRMPSPPDAIFFENDLFALYGINELKKEGINVPKEIGVVGFDDLPFAAHISPSLTTIRQHCEEMGVKAKELLYEMVSPKGEKKFSSLEIKVPVKLMVRESSRKGKEVR